MSRPTNRALRPAVARPVPVLRGLTREQQAIQDNLRNATEAARRDTHSRGRALRVRFEGYGTPPKFPQTKQFSHGLGRKPKGINVTKGRSGATGAGAITLEIGQSTTRLITLTSLMSASLELWVY